MLIVRVDRIELSKNVLRGFWAFEELLQARPDLRGRVVFAAMVYPSRLGLADYLAYGMEVSALATKINAEWGWPEGDGRPSWTPILLDREDNYPRSVAALRRADVLLVNPVRDGLNLVAKEGPLVNERDGVLVLSHQAGAWDELADHAVGINPFDVSGTACGAGDRPGYPHVGAGRQGPGPPQGHRSRDHRSTGSTTSGRRRPLRASAGGRPRTQAMAGVVVTRWSRSAHPPQSRPAFATVPSLLPDQAPPGLRRPGALPASPGPRPQQPGSPRRPPGDDGARRRPVDLRHRHRQSTPR